MSCAILDLSCSRNVKTNKKDTEETDRNDVEEDPNEHSMGVERRG